MVLGPLLPYLFLCSLNITSPTKSLFLATLGNTGFLNTRKACAAAQVLANDGTFDNSVVLVGIRLPIQGLKNVLFGTKPGTLFRCTKNRQILPKK
jgi:hypothetical protein